MTEPYRSDGYVHVDADDGPAGDALAALVNLSATNGARLHPTLRARARDGDLSIVASRIGGEPLVSIPTDLFVPIDQATWGISGDRFVIEAHSPDASTLQIEVAEAMVAVYNATGKLAQIGATHPAAAMRHDLELSDVVPMLRRGAVEAETDLAQIFLDTRYYHFGDRRYLLPIVDLLNHRTGGPPLRVAEGRMTIPVVPDADGECIVSYGPSYDALDLAWHYGFADLGTKHARSVPVSAEVEGVGTVVIEGRSIATTSRLDPPQFRMEPGELTLSHMTFHPDHPDWLRTVLELALAGFARRSVSMTRTPDLAARAVVAAIADQNTRVLDAAAAALDRSDRIAARVLASAVRHQRHVVARAADAYCAR